MPLKKNKWRERSLHKSCGTRNRSSVVLVQSPVSHFRGDPAEVLRQLLLSSVSVPTRVSCCFAWNKRIHFYRSRNVCKFLSLSQTASFDEYRNETEWRDLRNMSSFCPGVLQTTHRLLRSSLCFSVTLCHFGQDMNPVEKWSKWMFLSWIPGMSPCWVWATAIHSNPWPSVWYPNCKAFGGGWPALRTNKYAIFSCRKCSINVMNIYYFLQTEKGIYREIGHWFPRIRILSTLC